MGEVSTPKKRIEIKNILLNSHQSIKVIEAADHLRKDTQIKIMAENNQEMVAQIEN